MTIKRIHVNQHLIRYNTAHPNEPSKEVISVQFSHGVVRGQEVEIMGPSKLVSSRKQLHCGARVWIETTAPIIITQASGGFCQYD